MCSRLPSHLIVRKSVRALRAEEITPLIAKNHALKSLSLRHSVS